MGCLFLSSPHPHLSFEPLGMEVSILLLFLSGNYLLTVRSLLGCESLWGCYTMSHYLYNLPSQPHSMALAWNRCPIKVKHIVESRRSAVRSGGLRSLLGISFQEEDWVRVLEEDNVKGSRQCGNSQNLIDWPCMSGSWAFCVAPLWHCFLTLGWPSVPSSTFSLHSNSSWLDCKLRLLKG